METNGGRVIGDFKIVRRIGSGGMGTVYEAVQQSANRKVALKLMLPSFARTETDVKRFHREIKIIAELDHPNIITIYTAGEREGEHFYAMKYIDGLSLDKIIKCLALRAASGGLSDTEDVDDSAATVRDIIKKDEATPAGEQSAVLDVEEAGREDEDIEDFVEIPEAALKLMELYEDDDKKRWAREVAGLFAPVAEALHHAHSKGIIHRDMKPGNLLLDPSGRLIITDFGLAKVTDAESLRTLTDMGTLVGTVMYMSPEQIAGGRIKLDHKTDIYALGATLYEFLTLKTPFPSDVPREELFYKKVFETPPPPCKVNPRVPKVLSKIVEKAIQRAPHYRYQSAQQFADHLRDFSEGRPVKVSGLTERISRWVAQTGKRGKPTAAAVAICLVILLISFLAYRFSVIYEVHKKLSAANELVEKGDYQTALEIALYLTAKYPDEHPHVDDAFVMAGVCQDRLGRKERALQAFVAAYSVLKSKKSRAKALYYLGEHFADASDFRPDFDKACNLFRKLLARYPESEVSPRARLKLGEALLNMQRVDEAREYLELAANDGSLSAEERQRAQQDLSFLRKFFPTLCRLNFSQGRFGEIQVAEMGDIDADGKSELVVAGGKGLTIMEVEDGTFSPTLHFPVSEQVNELCLGDTDGDGKSEIIAAHENPDKDLDCNDVIRIYKQADGTLKEIWSDEAGSSILNNCIAIGDTDDDGENEIAAGMHDYGRDSRLYDRVGPYKYTKILLNPDLQPSNTGGVTTNTHAVTVADVDGDRKSETIMGTGPFHGYDVRVVKFNPNVGNYQLAWRKKIGNILALQVGDVDGDGMNEIVAAKSFTDTDTANLGEFTPRGEPNGLYIFKFQKDHRDYGRIWSDLMVKGKPGKPDCREVIVRDFDRDGLSEIIALWHALEKRTCWLDAYSFATLGLDRKLELDKRRIFYASPAVSLKAGDIDGDGDAELIVIGKDCLDIYGLDARLGKELASIQTDIPPLSDVQKEATPLAIAEDLRDMGFLDLACKSFKKLADEAPSDDLRVSAWDAAADCLIRAERQDEALKLLDQFERAYPAEAKEIAFKKLDILERQWKWQEAYILLGEINAMPDLSAQERNRVEDDLSWVGILTLPQHTKIFSEDFSNGITGRWKITNPQKFRVTADGALHLLQARLSNDFARAFVPWRGGSFTLKFDVKIKDVMWNSDTAFGLIREVGDDQEARQDFMLIEFGLFGGGNLERGEGSFCYNVCSKVATTKTIADTSSKHRQGFTGGTRYRIETTYIEPLGEVRTVVRDMNLGKEFVLSLRGDIDFEEGKYYLGNIPRVRNTMMADHWSDFTVDNIELFNLDPDYVAPTEPPSLDGLGEDPLLKANCEALSGDLDQAIRDYTRAIESEDDPARAYYFRGLCFKDMGDLLSAFRDYDKALELADDLRYLMELGGETREGAPRPYALDGKLAIEYFSDSDYDDMLKECSRRIDGGESGASAKDYFTRGLIHYYKRDYSDALRDLGRAATLDEGNAEYCLRLGRCCLLLKNLTGAAEYFDIARRLSPSDHRVYYAAGMLHQMQGRCADAIRDFTKANELTPRFIHFMSRAYCFFNGNKMEAGVSDLRRAISLTGYAPLKGLIMGRIARL